MSRLDEIRAQHAEHDMSDGDEFYLLGLVNQLVAAANEVLRVYMPQFPDSRAVDDCLVRLAVAVSSTNSGIRDASKRTRS